MRRSTAYETAPQMPTTSTRTFRVRGHVGVKANPFLQLSAASGMTHDGVYV
jgi:hypothetical protein